MIKLTAMEIKILNAMRQNEYNDALEDGYTWTFTAIDNSGVAKKSVAGVISSLVKKGLVVAERADTVENDTIAFTDKGAELFKKADGKDCSWGGPKLLKEEAERNETKKEEVIVVAFTGMVIGTFKVHSRNNSSHEIVVKTAKGSLMIFDSATGIQKNAKNVKFANRIKI